MAVKRPILHQRTKFRKDWSNRCGDFAIFVIFQMAATAILNYQKFEILTAFPLWGQYVSSCQISSKSVKRLQRYGDLTVFKMAAVRHLGSVKFEIFNGRTVKRPILHQSTKFRKDRSNRCGDIAIFVIFQMAAAAILNSQKFEILTAFPFIKIGQTVAEVWRFNGFQNGGRPPSWICEIRTF